MAAIMCFWSLSGLFMWWQIKATRVPGLIVLGLSAAAATAAGLCHARVPELVNSCRIQSNP